ncbi:ABC transporter permease [Cohnella faecalis]|uniref:ABC transporter permease n=1 Tax=Cohnella faecalis TaxID=2315694 RepID=A0A398CEX2_9BACL|nr:ABC transporter permease [Cohnella faecalis]RIE01273.1 ABC transporter permease [Cohnella faecalis]
MIGYGALAGRYLKQQRRKSTLTVFGIILSVALICALGTMGQALKDNLLKQQMYEDGSWHFAYTPNSAELYDKLSHHALVDRTGALISGDITALADDYKIAVNDANADALQLLPIHLAEGRLPAAPNELAAEQWIVQRLPGKPKLGDTVRLNGPDGQLRDYALVGTLKNGRQSQVEGVGAAYAGLDDAKVASIPGKTSLQLYVTLREGADISRHLPEFEKLDGSFRDNNQVLALMGESSSNDLNQALAIIFGTLVGLVVLSTVAVIYNSFHISVLERIRQFGLLRTLGATPRQIRNLVLREATTLALIGIPFGLAIGWGGLYLVLWLMIQGGFQILQMENFHLTFHWWIMGLSVGVGIAAVYMAAWLPARKASRVSPVEAVKGAGSIVRESYRRARIPSPLHSLGVEGKMASKNIRRNRTKFRITTFSIVVSITLFIVFHYFAQQVFDTAIQSNEDNRISFELQRTNMSFRVNDDGTVPPVQDIVPPETIGQLEAMPGVDDVYGNYQSPVAKVLVPENKVNSRAEEVGGIHFVRSDWDGGVRAIVPTMLTLYDEARLKEAAKYVESGSADPKLLAEENGVLIVQTAKPYSKQSKKLNQLDLTTYKVGDTLTIHMGESDAIQSSTVREVKVAGILSESPFGSRYLDHGLTVIAAKSTFAMLLDSVPAAKNVPVYGTALLGLEIALKEGADTEPVKLKLEQIAAGIKGSQVIDIAAEQAQERQFGLQMKIFIYGFLGIIALIGSLNIINTVQTNLFLRRREFGLLQAVGMTMGQVRKMATTEGVWFGIIGSIWGLLCGGLLSYFLFVQMSNVQGMPFDFPWGGAAIACGFAICVGLLSVQGPLRRMQKANLIDTLREEA